MEQPALTGDSPQTPPQVPGGKEIDPTTAPPPDATQPQCAKCSRTGHWTWECLNPRVFATRPSRTQQLTNPSLVAPAVRAVPPKSDRPTSTRHPAAPTSTGAPPPAATQPSQAVVPIKRPPRPDSPSSSSDSCSTCSSGSSSDSSSDSSSSSSSSEEEVSPSRHHQPRPEQKRRR